MSKRTRRRPYFDYVPDPPVRPSPPQEAYESVNERIVKTFECDKGYVTLRELLDGCENLDLPPGSTRRDIIVFPRSSWDEPFIEVGYLEVTSFPNPYYKAQMKRYAQDVKRYEAEVNLQVKQLAEYNEHVKRDEERALKKRIRDARKLLKEHGELK